MARPLNSTKPLYATPPIRAGRPSSAKLTIGFLGPSAKLATPDDLAQAVIIGQIIAEHRHITAIYVDQPTTPAITRGVRDKAGVIIGFSSHKSSQTIEPGLHLQGIDTMLFTGSTLARQKLFLEALDVLIIQTYPAAQVEMNQPLPRNIPVGVLINNRESAQQVAHIVELAQPSQSTIDYSDNPKQLITTLIKLASK